MIGVSCLYCSKDRRIATELWRSPSSSHDLTLVYTREDPPARLGCVWPGRLTHTLCDIEQNLVWQGQERHRSGCGVWQRGRRSYAGDEKVTGIAEIDEAGATSAKRKSGAPPFVKTTRDVPYRPQAFE